MRKENVRCPMCGTMNYDVDLDETGGWTKCRLCKAVTCSMDEWKKHTVSAPDYFARITSFYRCVGHKKNLLQVH